MKCKLGEVCEIIGEGTPSTKISEYWDGNIPWITPKDLSIHKTVYISHGERNITEKGLKNSSTRLLPKGSVLFSSRAPIGYIAIAENDVCTNQGFKSLIPSEKTTSEFMYYWLKFNKENIENLGSGTTFKEVSGSVMKNIDIDLPPFTEQIEIGRTLSVLDAKIAANTAINHNLEQIAQTIFKHWFLDFEFPDENGNPYKSSGGAMVDSEMGQIPSRWRVGTFSEIIDATVSGDWGKESEQGNYSEKVVCIRGADIPEIEKGNRGNAPIRYIINKNLANKALGSNDLVVEISGGSPTQSTGRSAFISTALISSYDTPIICTNFCRALKFANSDYSVFSYMYFKYLYENNVFFKYENGCI